jgi:hypothetical protein
MMLEQSRDIGKENGGEIDYEPKICSSVCQFIDC